MQPAQGQRSLIGTQYQNLTGASLLHIPYKGSGPITTDLLGGQVTMCRSTPSRRCCNTPEQMARQIKDETEKFGKMVKDAKDAIE